MEISLKGKFAWVVGGAGAIGYAVAGALAREGALVALSSRRPDALQQAAREIAAATGGETLAVPADVTSGASVRAAAEAVAKKWGAIDILVNSTTVPVFGDFLELTDADWELVLQTKYLGYVRTCRAVLPGMMQKKAGNIINISGGAGLRPNPVHLPGGSVNAAVILLGKGLADLYGEHNIRVNTIAPGPVKSPRWDAIVEAKARAAGEEPPADTTPAPGVPLGRIAVPEDIADTVLYLASDLSKFVTGRTIVLDGGSYPGV